MHYAQKLDRAVAQFSLAVSLSTCRLIDLLLRSVGVQIWNRVCTVFAGEI